MSRRIEWVRIPKGRFISGLSAEQKAEMQRRLYEGYGIDQLPPQRQRWLESTMDKSVFEYGPEEKGIWREMVVDGDRAAIDYKYAIWALDHIPEARSRPVNTFYIARFPITYGQAAPFFRSTIAKKMGWKQMEVAKGYDRPAMFQWWDQAAAMAHWLGGRLPSRLEWEKAARGRNGRLYPWGDRWEAGRAHVDPGELPLLGASKRYGGIGAVDAYPEGASPYGVMDMVGNLSEWTDLRDDNQVGSMGYSAKQIQEGFEWFWALPMHYQGSTRAQPDRYICFRPVLHEWGRRLWPGHRRGLG